MQRKNKFKILLFIWLIAIAFASALPILWIRFNLEDNWRGVIPNYITDSTFYLARINKTIADFPMSGNHYYLEHRFDSQPVFSIAETIVALPMKFGISFNAGLLLGFIAASIFFALFTYKFLRFFVGRLWAVILASLVYVVSYGGLVRPVVMEVIMPAFIFFNWSMFSWLQSEKKRYGIFLGLAIAASFYLYSYLWQIVVLVVFFTCIYLMIFRQWKKFSVLLKISFLSLIMATPAIFYTFKVSFLTPGYWENVQRVGFVATHLPPIEAYYYGRWLIMAGLIWVLFFRKQLKEKTITIWYFLIVSAAVFLALVSNAITGKDFLIATHVNRFTTVWFALVLGMFLYYFIILKLYRGKMFVVIVALFLMLIGTLTVFAEIKRSVSPPFSISYTDALAVQDYRAPLAWLDGSEKEPVVIWADDELSRYVPYLSKHYVLYPGLLNVHFYIMQTSEIRERYLVSQYFENLSKKTLTEEYVKYEGSYFDYKKNELELRNSLCTMFKIRAEFCREDFLDTLNVQKNDAVAEAFKLNNETIRPNIRQYLKKYHVSYFIRDITRGPLSAKQRSFTMTSVYNDGHYEIFKID
ncbi:MAG: hypothetical protein UW43_C0002G0022 [Candidatus Yanofskybacteria bacterium GW2011_GWA1_44_21]|uniref:Glycosyltransferase RgtA/B/C/D-like domain-containing protein n=2 Tax=Parcubacteria group TaxID=1794811 RepID=A0A1F8H0K4_9BACT|nr:MAG: hypothetical protein UU38_C0004G0066 [Candidatus Wolfebacteria bacterium GW2011_GWB1_41_12]KKT28956.1 MAG: hypothetical protein UW14_C0001G0067 [Candidatus Yanofskybacteria bacterium GW2011_GWA2_44_10]KKT50738.1 MAG: hypothetical protein UW43_C0002G0022 [Candidatus Yanofskybacteria bacterium GW2011_GWA1_44_21]OGN03495.1 MAG: hypothetical protein A2657_02315 [Candidatus Yanofskybacteria bacterium RIFCSPHIGHO2_01_FULL_44_110b]OGN14185.1 MAG: hypothetical protein A3C01_01140 [Candidatus Ya